MFLFLEIKIRELIKKIKNQLEQLIFLHRTLNVIILNMDNYYAFKH